MRPSHTEFAAATMAVLAVTSAYDCHQPGTVEYHRRHDAASSETARARQFLVIAPGGHYVSRPTTSIGGIHFGRDSGVDMLDLSIDWFDWVLRGGERPRLLKDRVTYYLAGAEEWRHAPSLDAVTARHMPLYLASQGDAGVFGSGRLAPRLASQGGEDVYVDDPHDARRMEADLDEMPTEGNSPPSLVSQARTLRNDGAQAVYHGDPLPAPLTIAGFFGLDV